MPKLKSIDAETLLYKPVIQTQFIVDQLIPYGLTLFCGSQKIGKSWLMLDLCCRVSTGQPFWGMETKQCGVLYLCLEDTAARIQNRLFTLVDDASPDLRFSNELHKINQDLIEYLEDYHKAYPNLGLIVVDTLQKIRESSSENAYAHDYSDLSKLKYFADTHKIAIVLVHHLRKQGDSDVFNQISGTAGLAGCADASFVLKRADRGADSAKLFLTGRDVEYQEFDLKFSSCRWELVHRKTQKELVKAVTPQIIYDVAAFMKDKPLWQGKASDLLEALGKTEIAPNVLAKQLNQFSIPFLMEHGIVYESGREHDGRYIKLGKRDGGDDGDDKCEIYDEASPTVTDSVIPETQQRDESPQDEVPPPEAAPPEQLPESAAFPQGVQEERLAHDL